MKQKIKIYTEKTVLYEGKLQDVPLKEEYIVKKSIELFDDDDPCIIHKSYVVKEYADKILDLLKVKSTVLAKDCKELLDCLNIDITEDTKINLLG